MISWFPLLGILACVVVVHADYLSYGTQSTLRSDNDSGGTSSSPRKVAIIGSGIAGASAAHHLHQLTRRYYPLNITVCEREARIGGQIKSITLRYRPGRTVEVGAVSFFDHDWCMVGAMREVGLKPAKTESKHKFTKRTGVWDGEDFMHVSEPTNGYGDTFWRLATSYWRYGFSGSHFRDVTQTAAARFKNFAIFGTFRDLAKAVNDRNLQHEISHSAQDHLSYISGIGQNFLQEAVRPAVRARSLLDIEAIDSLAALNGRARCETSMDKRGKLASSEPYAENIGGQGRAQLLRDEHSTWNKQQVAGAMERKPIH